MLRARTACPFSTSQLPKVVREWCVLYILTSKCASRHNGVHFFDISTSKSAPQRVHFFDIATSKSGPNMWCFVHFDFETSRHNRVHFFDISTSKSGAYMWCFVHFDLEICFAPQRVQFSSLIWPDGSAPAALASLLLDPPEPQIIGKHSVSRLSYLSAHLHLLSFDSFSSLTFSLLLFSSL